MRVLRGILFISFCFLWGYCTPETLNAAEKNKETLSLDTLYTLAREHVQQQVGFMYTTRLLEEARRQKNSYQEANAMFCYVRYYYSKNPDSLYFWMQKALPLFLEQNRLVKYFRMKAWYIYVLTRSKKNEEALKYVTCLKEEAVTLKFPEGMEMANQALADFYLSNNLEEEGVALYEEVINSMEMRNAPLIKRVNIIRQLMNKSTNLEKKMKYTHRLEEYIKICKEKGIEWLDNENPLYYLEYVVHRHYAILYIAEDKLPEALKHLKKAEEYIREHEMYSYSSELQTIYGAYYKQSKQYNRALAVYDSLLPVWRERRTMQGYLEMLQDKADVLFESGRDRAASLAYKEYAFLNDSLSQVRFYQELAEMAAVRGEQPSADLAVRDAEVTQLCRGLAEEIFGQKHLRVRKFFAEAITRNGRQSYAQELSLACRRRYLVNGAADQVLAGVAELAAQQGHNLDLYYSCMAPEQLEMVIIPGLSVALVDCACPELEARYEDVLLNLRPEGEAELAEEADAAEQIWLHYLDNAVLELDNEHRLHDELESYYIAAMDFEALDAVCKDIFGKIWQLAAERS